MLKRGGTAVFVGIVPIGQRVDFHIADITFQENPPDRFADGLEPLPARHAALRRLLPRRPGCRLDEMISARIGLDGVNDAFDRPAQG